MKPGENCLPGVFVGFVCRSVACSFARALFAPLLSCFCFFLSAVLDFSVFLHTAPFFAFSFIPFKNKTKTKGGRGREGGRERGGGEGETEKEREGKKWTRWPAAFTVILTNKNNIDF